MSTAKETKPVLIIGAGVSGLALGNFLLREGIDCVVFERRSREYVEHRQRAGVIDPKAARATDVTIEDHERPRVRLGDGSIVEGDFIAGCDGNHGATRTAIPEDRITRHTHEYGYAWLVILAEVTAHQQTLMAIHRRGFAAQFGRGPRASRFYLQCPLDDTTEEWPDERIWSELEARFGEPLTDKGAIVEKQLVPLRGEMISPMSYGRLHLLDAYSDTRLHDVWNYQALATWFTDTVHDAGDATYRGEFRHRVARADFERLYTSSTANRLLSEFMAGLN